MSDPIDPNFTDDNCDGGDGNVEQCVYVSTSQGDDTTGDGSRQSPLKTIGIAILKAKANAVPSVCLSGEVYNEAVSVMSGMHTAMRTGTSPRCSAKWRDAASRMTAPVESPP